MKKTYIIPEVQILRMETANIIAASDPKDVTVNRNGSVNAADVEVKGERSNYNVWNEDWSN